MQILSVRDALLSVTVWQMKVKTLTKLRTARMFKDVTRMQALRSRFVLAKFNLQNKLDDLKQTLGL